MSAFFQITPGLFTFKVDTQWVLPYNKCLYHSTTGYIMYTFQLQIRLDHGQRMAYVQVQAGNSLDARALGESMYGSGNVSNVTQVNG